MFQWANTKDALAAILLLITLRVGLAYNVDTQFPLVFSGTKGSYFGYTTALYYNRWGPLVLVGAPRSNTSTFSNAIKSVYQPGTLFRCNITDDPKRTCQEVRLMTEGAEEVNPNYSFAYKDMKDGMWLGVSLDVSRTRNDIVTCGHLWRNQYHSDLHLVNGVCYVINGDMDTDSIKLLPLTERVKQYAKVGDTSEYNHAHGQAGIAAIFTEDGSNLILGAPGIWSWTGSIVDYSINTGPGRRAYINPTIPSPPYAVDFNSYFGYSVTTGEFFQANEQLYAVGAPRDGMNFGKVYIVNLVFNDMRIRVRKQGFQLGEYFGASVLGIDLDGDKRTDLLVGAPTNSQESGGDEGKVYVYMSRGKDLVKSLELTGDTKVDARFGTALANAGDINQDGFEDVVIGAPYEDGHGAVYIYHCSKSGIKTPYAQKIEGFNVNPKLSGFGIHISRGLDIDQNGYPDFVVGSYISSHAVLFRSRPVIRVFPEIVFSPKQITMNQTACLFRGQSLTCINVDACLWYTGKHVPSHMDFVFTLFVEDGRGFFSEDERNKLRISRQQETVDVNQKKCRRFQLRLSDTITDFLTPIPVQFSSYLVKSSDVEKAFNKSFAMYHPSSPTEITAEIPFQHGCGEEGVCQSNLNVTAVRTEPTKSGVITLGEFSSVSVTVTVRNRGEPAYLSRLIVSVPSELSITSHDCKNTDQLNNTYLVCNVGNPLKIGTLEEIHLKLDAAKIPPLTRYLEIRFQADTKSNDTNPEDNEEVVALHLATVADFGVTGQSSHDQILYDGKNNWSPRITHTYIVRNHGPSRLQTINFELRLPYAFSTQDGPKPFLFLAPLKVDDGIQADIPANCDDSEFSVVPSIEERRQEIVNDDALLSEIDGDMSAPSNIDENIVRRPRAAYPADVKPDFDLDSDRGPSRNESELLAISGANSISCDLNENIVCVTLRCTADPFTDLRRFSQVSVDFELDFDVLNGELEKWDQIEFVTSGSVSVPDAVVEVLNHRPKFAHVQTIAIHEGPPPAKEVSPWIIFVSIGVGALLLLIILIILIKVGFFRRKEKDKMKELLYDAKQDEGNGDEQEIKEAEVLNE